MQVCIFPAPAHFPICIFLHLFTDLIVVWIEVQYVGGKGVRDSSVLLCFS